MIKMPKLISDNLTNWLLGLVAALGGFLGTRIINNQDKMMENIADMKTAVSVGMTERKDIKEKIEELKESNKKHDDRLNKIQGISATQTPFEDKKYFTLKSK